MTLSSFRHYRNLLVTDAIEQRDMSETAMGQCYCLRAKNYSYNLCFEGDLAILAWAMIVIFTTGVTYGFGCYDELVSAGADAVCDLQQKILETIALLSS